MGKDVLAVEDVEKDESHDIGEELGQPGPEGGINVHRVLLVAPLHCCGPQSPVTDWVKFYRYVFSASNLYKAKLRTLGDVCYYFIL